MKHITLTPGESAGYDEGNGVAPAARALYEARVAEAAFLHAETGETVEVYHADGFVAAVIQS